MQGNLKFEQTVPPLPSTIIHYKVFFKQQNSKNRFLIALKNKKNAHNHGILLF